MGKWRRVIRAHEWWGLVGVTRGPIESHDYDLGRGEMARIRRKCGVGSPCVEQERDTFTCYLKFDPWHGEGNQSRKARAPLVV